MNCCLYLPMHRHTQPKLPIFATDFFFFFASFHFRHVMLYCSEYRLFFLLHFTVPALAIFIYVCPSFNSFSGFEKQNEACRTLYCTNNFSLNDFSSAGHSCDLQYNSIAPAYKFTLLDSICSFIEISMTCRIFAVFWLPYYFHE